MKEKHFAYKIISNSSGLVSTCAEIEEDKMLDLLKLIDKDNTIGLYWIFKQLDNKLHEPLCIIDCTHKRVYYHYSGDVEDLEKTIKKLTK